MSSKHNLIAAYSAPSHRPRRQIYDGNEPIDASIDSQVIFRIFDANFRTGRVWKWWMSAGMLSCAGLRIQVSPRSKPRAEISLLVARHIDSAEYYKNEEEVGRAIRESGIPREEIFVSELGFATPDRATTYPASSTKQRRYIILILALNQRNIMLLHPCKNSDFVRRMFPQTSL